MTHGGNQQAPKSEATRLPQTHIDARYAPDFATESDLADRRRIGGYSQIQATRSDRSDHARPDR